MIMKYNTQLRYQIIELFRDINTQLSKKMIYYRLMLIDLLIFLSRFSVVLQTEVIFCSLAFDRIQVCKFLEIVSKTTKKKVWKGKKSEDHK